MNKRKMECKEPLCFCPQESLLKFCEIACGAELAAYGKEIARQIASRLVIRKGQGRVLETDLVRELVNVLDGKEAQLSNAVISSYACFIHGAKSLVEFDFPDESESNGLKRVTKELGDILLIFSVIDENIGGVIFQKMNFSQAKMAYRGKTVFSWEIDKQQLYLSSHFPSFRSAGSFLPRASKYDISNTSGCLGSFALLDGYGNMTWIGSPLLEALLGPASRINHKKIAELYKAMDLKPVDVSTLLMCYMFSEDLWKSNRRLVFTTTDIIPFGSRLLIPNTDTFIDAYLRGCLGEMAYFFGGFYNRSALFLLYDVIKTLKLVVPKANEELKRFVNSLTMLIYLDGIDETRSTNGKNMQHDLIYEDEDEEKEGMGLIHTVIRLRHR